MKLDRIAGPAGDFLTLDQIKAHLRVLHDDEDDLITAFGETAMAHIDGIRGVLGRCIQPQEWRLTFGDGLGGDCIRLPFPGIDAVSATWRDDAGDEHDADLRRTDCGVWTDVVITAPSGRPVKITFTASTPEDAWPAIRTAMLLLIGHWYRNREAVSVDARFDTLPFAVRSLLSPLKVHWV
ncbi:MULTISPECIES: head-tail connector protein [Paracoccus]|uniref:head-tail connector protein n=1 Tax=Paracoccus TaxID=265 RepID=UPI0025829A5B|nr:head-tail connector protein [Paracoccus sp. (in: a-proteobacteria)]